MLLTPKKSCVIGSFFMFICKCEMKASIPYCYWQTLFLMNGYQFQDCAASLKLAMIYWRRVMWTGQWVKPWHLALF